MNLFITDYASYNNGSQFVFGHWVSLEDFNDAKEFMAYVFDHLAECDELDPLPGGEKREEPMFTDFEGFPKGLYSESMSEDDIQLIYDFMAAIEKSYLDNEAIIGYIEHLGLDYNEDSVQEAEENYQGEYDNDQNFAYQLADDCGYLDKKVSWPYTCIDWERAAREVMYYYFEIDGYYFRINFF